MKTKLIVLGLGVALTVGVAVNGAASGARVQSPAAAARQLVAKLEQARTPGARYQAVLAMMKVLRVPVFTAAGHVVAAGGGGFQKGFNLYDFQLRAAAETLGNEMSLTDLAGALSGSRRVDPGKLDASLTSGVAAAVARSSSPTSMLALLVRELGLQQKPPVDLATKPRASAVQLDPLQMLLLAVDAAEHKPVVAFRRLAASTGPADYTCYQPPGSAASGVPLLGQDWQGVNAVATDAAAMKLLPGPSPALETHYGPAGHPGGGPLAGKHVQLGVHVVIVQRFPDEYACGPFRNIVKTGRPPQQGSIPVYWTIDEILSGSLDSVRVDHATGSNGEALVELRPKNEKVPGFGPIVTRAGLVSATVTLPDALRGSTIGIKPSRLRISVAQVVTVELHKPHGFKFQTTLTFTKAVPGIGTITDTSELDGRICGDDPYAAGGWSLTDTEIETNPISGTTATPPETVTGVVWPSGGTLDRSPTTLQLDLGSGPPFKVERTTTIQFYDQPTQSGTFDLIDDTSCPETK